MANGIRYARPTIRALRLAASSKGQALAKSIGRSKMVSGAVRRYGYNGAGFRRPTVGRRR